MLDNENCEVWGEWKKHIASQQKRPENRKEKLRKIGWQQKKNE